MSTDAFVEIGRIGILPVIVSRRPEHAAAAAAAMVAAGLGCGEVALRTPASFDVLSEMSSVSGFLVGAGTVRSRADIDRAADAGARFLVSPGIDADLVAHANDTGLPILPGIATPSELLLADRLDLQRVKLFPAGMIGGSAYIDALAGPFPDKLFLPSGGVDANNAAALAAHPSVFAVSGSWMAPAELMDLGEVDEIRIRSAEAVRLVER